MLPGENAPPMNPWCRCSTAAYMNGKEYEDWLEFLDKDGTTEKWKQADSLQERITVISYGEQSKNLFEVEDFVHVHTPMA